MTPPRHLHQDGPLNALQSILRILVAAVFFTTFIAQPLRIPTASMSPTLRVGDFFLLDKQTFAPRSEPDQAGRYGVLPRSQVHRGDIVVFHWPVDPTLHLIKRVVAVPGDRLRLRHGRLYLNGVLQNEPYAVYNPSRPNTFRDEFPSLREADPNVEPAWWIALRRALKPTTKKGAGAPGLASETWDAASAELTVPPNSYFVLGDNRNSSEDSRYWGFVPRSAIVGRPLFVYFALNQETPRSSLRETLHYALSSLRILR
jgi:signal peptidase I